MNLFRRIIYFFAVIGLMTGCAQSAINPTQATTPSTVPSATKLAVTDTPIPSPTRNILSTPTIQPTPTITNEKNCLTLEDQLPSDLHLTGVWVRGDMRPYLENIENKTNIGIPLKGNSRLEEFAISGDKKWFAYIDNYVKDNKTSKRTLRVISSAGYSLDLDQWLADFQWIDTWSQSRELILDLNPFSTTHRKFTLLNPFTGKYQFIQSSWLKDIDSYYPDILFAPNLNFVASVSSGYLNGNLEIRDAKTGDVVLNRAGDYDLDAIAWSPDGTRLVVAQNSSVILFKSENFKNEFRYRISDSNKQVVWAPDSKKIVFVGYRNRNITVLDTQSEKTTIYCINNKQYQYDYDWENLSWSPDERYIIVNVYRHIVPFTYPFKGETFDLLIDIERSQAFYLPAKSSSYREAWLAAP